MPGRVRVCQHALKPSARPSLIIALPSAYSNFLSQACDGLRHHPWNDQASLFPPMQLLSNITSKTLQLIQLCFTLNLAPRPPNRPSYISYPRKTYLLLQLGIIFFHARVLELPNQWVVQVSRGAIIFFWAAVWFWPANQNTAKSHHLKDALLDPLITAYTNIISITFSFPNKDVQKNRWGRNEHYGSGANPIWCLIFQW